MNTLFGYPVVEVDGDPTPAGEIVLGSWEALKRARPGQVEMDRLVAETRLLAQALAVRNLSPKAFTDALSDLLEAAHTEAVLLGRGRAGDFAPEEPDDRRFAGQVVDGEAEYLAAFRADLEDGRYADQPEAIARRAELYSGRLVGTANEVWALAGEETARYHWRLGGAEAHCEDCPALARGGPYTLAQLRGRFPGSNQTACLFNCRCYLEREDGARSFRVPE